MINNVAVVGHSHPRVAAAAARQFRLLNTNSRFLYESMTDYAARLVPRAAAGRAGPRVPRQLGLGGVRSGAAAGARLHRSPGRRRARGRLPRLDLGGVRSLHRADNPAGARPSRRSCTSRRSPTPTAARSATTRRPTSARSRIACDAAAGPAGGVAAFISEPLLGNQGAVEPPEGFLAGAYAAVRAAGGVCIADEIQVGYGRTGDSFWAFEHERVTPDIVAVAKATGNGHPLGAVICRPRSPMRWPPGGILLLDRRRARLLRDRPGGARRDRRRGTAGQRRARRCRAEAVADRAGRRSRADRVRSTAGACTWGRPRARPRHA